MTTHAEAQATPDDFTRAYRNTLTAHATYAQAFKMATLAAGSQCINAGALSFLIEINENQIVHAERTVQLATGQARSHAAYRLERALGVTAQLKIERDALTAEG